MQKTTVDRAEDPLQGLAGSVLQAAMGHPGAPSIPGAARITAGLIGLLAAEGGDEPAARFLAVSPGEPTTFDVECDGGGQDEDGRWRGLPLGPALRQASRLAQTGVRKVTVTAVSPSGARRRVLEWAGSGSFQYVYPTGEHAERWREWMAATEATPPATRSEGATDVDQLVTAVRKALADVSVEVDIGAITDAVNEAVSTALAEARATLPAVDTSPASLAAQSGAVAEQVVAALAPEIAGQLGQITGRVGDIPGGWVAQATLVAAADELHVQLQSFSDRVRAGSRALEDLADELAQRERSAADFTEQLAKSLQSNIDRLIRHIDDRLDDLSRGGGHMTGHKS